MPARKGKKTAGAYKSGNLPSFIRPKREITHKLNAFFCRQDKCGAYKSTRTRPIIRPDGTRHNNFEHFTRDIRSSRPSIAPISRSDKCAHKRLLNGCPCPTGCDMTNERYNREPQATRLNESWRRKRVRNRTFFTPYDERAVKKEPPVLPGSPFRRRIGGEF